MLPACRVPPPPDGHHIGVWKRRAPRNTILNQPYRRRVLTDQRSREDSQLTTPLDEEPGPTPAGKIITHSYPKTRFPFSSFSTPAFNFKVPGLLFLTADGARCNIPSHIPHDYYFRTICVVPSLSVIGDPKLHWTYADVWFCCVRLM